MNLKELLENKGFVKNDYKMKYNLGDLEFNVLITLILCFFITSSLFFFNDLDIINNFWFQILVALNIIFGIIYIQNRFNKFRKEYDLFQKFIFKTEIAEESKEEKSVEKPID
jgi:uncharacterized protein YacL